MYQYSVFSRHFFFFFYFFCLVYIKLLIALVSLDKDIRPLTLIMIDIREDVKTLKIQGKIRNLISSCF